jgi:hypothetical protein
LAGSRGAHRTSDAGVIAGEIGGGGMATGTDLYVVDLQKTILSRLRRFVFRRG